MAKDKVKKPNFFKRLKDKIESYFASDSLTFAGKIYMLSIYLASCGFFGICVCSAINTITYIVTAFGNAAIGAMPAGENGEQIASEIKIVAGDCLAAAETACWLLFVICGLGFIALTIAEIADNVDNSESLLERND
jgi:hypothetical protein